jgi:hypothetical protein
MAITMEHTMRQDYYISDTLTKETVRYRRKTMSELEQAFEVVKSSVSGALPEAKVSMTPCDGRPRARKLTIESSYDESAIRAAVRKCMDVAQLLADASPPS